MPTIPISEFVSRRIDEPKISHLLEHMSSLIEEVVNYGSHVFRWAIDSIKAGDENAPALLMYRHIFELIDSVSVLVRNACAEPCNILLRCLFESVLNYEYLFEKEFKTRGMDFLVWHRRKNLEVMKRFDPREAAFVRFEKMKEMDKISKNIQGRAVPDIEERIKSLQAIFLLPSYRDSSAEFDRIVALTGRPPKNWYSMRNGPDNLRQLAEYLGFPAQYEILYSSWSGLVHGTDILEDKISIVGPGVVAFSQLRFPSESPLISQMAISFGLSTIKTLTEHYVPDRAKENAAWYQKEMKGPYQDLAKIKIVVLE